MSLSPLTLSIFQQAGARLAAHGCASRRVLSLGYPDILASPERLEAIFGTGFAKRLTFREDSESIRRWHHLQGDWDVADARSLFAVLGYELDVIDIAEARGGEIIQDLNHPVPESMHARYAAVIDAGTLEHCFNIGQAAMNAAAMTAVGGFVMHGNPVNMYNHGFYNLSPVWYHDFYRANAFDVELAVLVNGPIDSPAVREAPRQERFVGVPENTVQIVIARRKALAPIAWPTQGKYVAHPTLHG